IVGTLKPGGHEQAKALLEGGPPFDLAEQKFERHWVFLTSNEVVFVFEGEDVDRTVDDLLDDFRRAGLKKAVHRWEEILEGAPRVGFEAFAWERPGSPQTPGGAG